MINLPTSFQQIFFAFRSIKIALFLILLAIAFAVGAFALASADIKTENAGIYQPRIVLNELGNPVILLQTKAPSDLKLVVCDDPLCSTRSVSIVYHDRSVDPDPGDENCCDGGVLSSDLALNSKGYPVIVAYSEGRFDAGVKLIICEDAVCSSSETLRFAGMPIDTGVQLTSKDFPVITSKGTGDVQDRLASQSYICLDVNCLTWKATGTPSLSWPDPNPYSPSFDMDSLDYQMRLVSHPEINGFYVIPCVSRDADSNCTGLLPAHVLRSEVPEMTQNFILRLNDNDLPVIAYLRTQSDKDAIAIVNCDSDRCNEYSLTNLAEESVDDIGFYAPQFNVLDFDNFSRPIFSYGIISQHETIIARCNQPECLSMKKASISSNGLHEFDISTDGKIVMIAENFSDESLKLYTVDFETMETTVTDLTDIASTSNNPNPTPSPTLTPVTSNTSCSTFLPTVIKD